jgi:hypothetical protein
MGNVSVNNAKLAAVALALPRVRVRVEFPPALMVLGLKLLMSVGAMLCGAVTVKVSLAGGAAPLSVTRESVVFTWGPTTDEVTVPVTVQKLLAGIEPPVKVTVPEVFEIAALQVLATEPTNVTPVGNVSPNDVMLAAVLLELLKVRVRVEFPPTPMLLGLKALTSVGGTATEHARGVTRLVSIVTAPPPPGSSPARALPVTLAPVLRVMLVNARILPMNDVVVPRVAELPTCQKTLHGCPAAPLAVLITTDEPDPVMRVLTVLNIQTSLAVPERVSVPVKLAEDAKQ